MLRLAFVHAWVWHTKLVCHIDRHRLKIQPCLVEEDGVLRILDFDWHCGCVRDDGVHFEWDQRFDLGAYCIIHDIRNQLGDIGNSFAKVCQAGIIERLNRFIFGQPDEILKCGCITNCRNHPTIS